MKLPTDTTPPAGPARRRRPRAAWRSLGAAALAALALAGCQDAPAPPAAEIQAPIFQEGQLRFPAGHPHLALLTTVAAEAAGTSQVELPARLVWNEQRTQRVLPSFSGRVTALLADVGQSVRPGTVLARLASPDFGAAQADVAKAQVDAQLTDKSLRRQRELFEAGIVARKELEQAEADAARAQAELARAQARTALYGHSGAIDQQLALVSSLGGVVVERNLNPGQELRPDPYGPGVPPPFVISDPSELWALIDARESDVAALRAGQTFELLVPTLPGQRFTGRVAVVSDAIDPTTRTVKLRAVVPNPQRLLRAEMLATARFVRSLGEGVTVPASAVLLRGGQHYVYVRVGAAAFEPREVTLTSLGPTQVVVTKGLQPGDRVVSDNLLLLARQLRQAQTEVQPAPAATGPATAAPARAASGGRP